MSTETAAVLFEFRCNHCFHTQYAALAQEGYEVQCTSCHQLTKVPQATPDRIARAEAVQNSVKPAQPAPPTGASSSSNPYESSWKDADFEREAQRQFSADPRNMDSMAQIASSRLKRFAGCLIDGMLLGCAYAVSLTTFGVLVMLEYIATDVFDKNGGATILEKTSALSVIYVIPLIWSIIQWNMITVEGKSVGKKILGMKIIRADGENPGFVQGVVLRNWLRALLGLIPFFGLADSLCIFGDSKRCIHDFIAGTHVIDSR